VVDLSNVSLSDLAAATGDVDFGNNKGVNVADPDVNQDAATKKYHDDHKYTDAEAVAACDTANKFVERDEENVLTSEIDFKRASVGKFMDLLVQQAGQFIFGDLMLATVESTTHTFQQMYSGVVFPSVNMKGTDVTKVIGALLWMKQLNTLESGCYIKLADSAGNLQTSVSVFDTHIHFRWQTLDDLKNHADATLSGTPKLIEFKINDQSYYFKVYPIKT